eukprot:282572-Chlamydomonas_euryale.AAC.2
MGRTPTLVHSQTKQSHKNITIPPTLKLKYELQALMEAPPLVEIHIQVHGTPVYGVSNRVVLLLQLQMRRRFLCLQRGNFARPAGPSS